MSSSDAAAVGRFAPSPSGYLHVGNLLSLLLAWLDCRALGGRLIFRMEDLDPARSKPLYRDALTEDLRWLGLDWDEGWPEPFCAQSARTELYRAAFARLQDMDLVYPCWCTRAQRLTAASAPHPGEAESDPRCPCARLSQREREALSLSGRPPAWKLRLPDLDVAVTDGHLGKITQNLQRDVGDTIIRRADGVFAYQLAAPLDDMLMGVTRVVRGRDLLDSTPRQHWLIRTLGGTPPEYLHGPLITDGTGKLSKRRGSLSTQVLRRETSPEALLGHLAKLSGLREDAAPVTARELLKDFSWAKLPKTDIPLPEGWPK